MPRVSGTPVNRLPQDVPEKLRPYTFHGVVFNRTTGSNATADCPWCGREGKFNVEIETGVWRCVVCNEGEDNGKAFKGGNATTFVRRLWERSYDLTTVDDYRELSQERKLLNFDTLIKWNLARSFLTHDWIVPGYNETGNLMQLYRWIANGKRRAFYLTPTLGHKLFGVNNYDAKKPKVWLCEGVWDGVAIWEVLGSCKIMNDVVVPTANPDASLLAEINVLCMPTSEVFFDNWIPLFKDKAVSLICQNDHPRHKCVCNKSYPVSVKACPECNSTKTIDLIQPASLAGMQRVAGLLTGAATELEYLHWGSGEEGYDLTRPSGYDPRDLICMG